MRLVWLDLETNGLDPQTDFVLELAVGVADLAAPFELSPVDRFVLRFTDEHTHGPHCEKRERPTDTAIRRWATGALSDNGGPCPACNFDPVARELHTRSGLLAECAASMTTMGEVEDYLLTLVHGEPDRGDDRPVLAGANVWFDRLFLRTHAPRFAARLGYRCYDVSAVKLFCESLGMPRIPKAEAHRATADVEESVRHARRCAEWLASRPTNPPLIVAGSSPIDPNPPWDPPIAAGGFGGRAFVPPQPDPTVHVEGLGPGRLQALTTGAVCDYAALCRDCGHVQSDHVPDGWCIVTVRLTSMDDPDTGCCKCPRFVPRDPGTGPGVYGKRASGRMDWGPLRIAAVERGPALASEVRAANGLPPVEPDAYCVTTPDGGCVSTDPRDVHRP